VLTVITGPPCGGKSTYARQHARPGDIVIDFDLIAQALGSAVDHGHSDHLAAVAAEARHAAIAEGIAQHHKGRRVWVIDTAPGAKRRKQYEIAGARYVTCTATPAELHARVKGNRPPQWHDRIDQWLAAHSEPAPRSSWTRW
jgi:hypothetical protein